MKGPGHVKTAEICIFEEFYGTITSPGDTNTIMPNNVLSVKKNAVVFVCFLTLIRKYLALTAHIVVLTWMILLVARRTSP